MKVRYIYSACIEIETKDIRIVTDPWFTPGAYDGSWHQFPRMKEPLAVLREPDVIYVSHIHPDHYDPRFIRQLFEKYGEKPVLIPDFEKNYLFFKSKSDDIKATPTKEATFGGTKIHIVPNIIPSESDIDSALIVHEGAQTVLNLNDCIWNDPHTQQVQDIVNSYGKELDLLALGYTGAGPFPQTYFDMETQKDILEQKADQKKASFFERYKIYCAAFPARHHLPFAGKYILGGRLAPLNHYRGIADPVEVAAFDPKAVVLADAGEGEIDLSTNKITAIRTQPYARDAIDREIADIAKLPLDYEKDITLPYDKINFMRILGAAYQRALRKTEVKQDYWFVMNVQKDGETRESFLFNCFTSQFEKVKPGAPLPEPRSDVFIDYRYLFGLLTTVYHWNNGEVGSMFDTRRHPPDNFQREAQSFLNFLCAA